MRGTDMPDLLLWTGRSFSVGGTQVTYGSVMMVVFFLAVSWVLANTAWGRHIYATGDDREAARLAGIRTDRVLVSVYLVGGVICAVAAWMLLGRAQAASPQAGQTENLDSITAVVVGGISLFGGRGRIIGAMIGALIVGVFDTGLALAGVDVLWRLFSVGVLIVGAAAIDQWIRRIQS